MKKITARSGFTLVELLVVIAIIGILAAVVVLIINPLELTRRSRDAARLTDFANLQQAINIAVQEATTSSQYMACKGSPGVCVAKSNAEVRVTDGTGWVRVNLGVQKSVSVPTLPVDPINDAANHYLYCGKEESWEVVTKLESDQQKPKMTTDGGASDLYYEVGSTLGLFSLAVGGDATCVY